MKIHPIPTGLFKLDGGAMFGVVPKSLWSRTNPADDKNLCTWAMRSMLIEEGDRLILIDCGIGDKQSEKFFAHYHLHGNDSLDHSLHQLGFTRDDITDVFLTHLHFDHCGGAVGYNPSKDRYEVRFPKARFWSNEAHWKWATQPNAREKASFLSENINPIEASCQLHFIERTDRFSSSPLPNIDVFFADGHTDAQMIPLLRYKGRTLAFMADLLPSTGHIPLPYVMGYDTRPLLTLEEKALFLTKAAKEDYVLFLEHDSINECCTVKETDKGVRLNEAGSFGDFFG